MAERRPVADGSGPESTFNKGARAVLALGCHLQSAQRPFAATLHPRCAQPYENSQRDKHQRELRPALPRAYAENTASLYWLRATWFTPDRHCRRAKMALYTGSCAAGTRVPGFDAPTGIGVRARAHKRPAKLQFHVSCTRTVPGADRDAVPRGAHPALRFRRERWRPTSPAFAQRRLRDEQNKVTPRVLLIQ